MKKTAIILLFLSLLACKQENNKITQEKNEIKVEINKNIETIGIILDLSDLGDYVLKNYSGDNKYELVKLIRKKFEPFKNHSSVLKVNELGKLGLLQFGYYYYGISFSDLPEFKQIQPNYPEFYENDSLVKTDIENKYKELNNSIIDFYKEAQIEKFINDNKSLYSEIISEVKKSLPNQNILETMEHFFGVYGNEYIISPSPTVFNGFNFGPTRNKVYYYVTGPSYDLKPLRNEISEINIKDTLGFYDKEYITDLAIHEFGHSFVRFLDKKPNRELIESLTYLNTPELKNNLEQIGEGTEWTTGFEEHLVRASEILIWRNLGEEKVAEQKLNYELNNDGLIYIREFTQSLNFFNSNKDKYKTLEQYFPQLITDLKTIKTVPNNGYK